MRRVGTRWLCGASVGCVDKAQDSPLGLGATFTHGRRLCHAVPMESTSGAGSGTQRMERLRECRIMARSGCRCAGRGWVAAALSLGCLAGLAVPPARTSPAILPSTAPAPPAGRVPPPQPPIRKALPKLKLIQLEGPSGLHEGDPITGNQRVRFAIRNDGSAPSEATVLRFQASAGAPSWFGGQVSIPAIQPGMTHAGTWPLGEGRAWPSGSLSLTATLDSSTPLGELRPEDLRRNAVLLVAPALQPRPVQFPVGTQAPARVSVPPMPGGTLHPSPPPPEPPGRRWITLDIVADGVTGSATGKRVVVLDVTADPLEGASAGKRVAVVDIDAQ